MVKLYCLKCKEKKEVDAEKSKLGKNRWAYKAICPTCGTKMFQFCSAD